jgi:hypothetical protein
MLPTAGLPHVTGRDLAELLDMSDAQLHTALGRELLGDGTGFAGEDPFRAQRYARQWLESKLSDLRREICDAPSVRQMLDSGSGGRLESAAIVLDLLESLKGRPQASIVAVILVRRGLDVVCGPSA